jgi:hypothetical protein
MNADTPSSDDDACDARLQYYLTDGALKQLDRSADIPSAAARVANRRAARPVNIVPRILNERCMMQMHHHVRDGFGKNVLPLLAVSYVEREEGAGHVRSPSSTQSSGSAPPRNRQCIERRAGIHGDRDHLDFPRSGLLNGRGPTSVISCTALLAPHRPVPGGGPTKPWFGPTAWRVLMGSRGARVLAPNPRSGVVPERSH